MTPHRALAQPKPTFSRSLNTITAALPPIRETHGATKRDFLSTLSGSTRCPQRVVVQITDPFVFLDIAPTLSG